MATGAVATLTSGDRLVAPTHIETNPAGEVFVAVTHAGEGAIVKVAASGAQTLHLTGTTKGSDFSFSPDGSELFYLYKHIECPIQCVATNSLWKIGSAGGVATSGTDQGAVGHHGRDGIDDMAWDAQGRLYVIWSGAGPGGLIAYPPQLYRFGTCQGV